VSLSLQQSDYFWADLLNQVDWYREHATPEIAGRLVDAVQATLHQLARTPGMGRPRFADWPELKAFARSESSVRSIASSSSTDAMLKRSLLND
jgi:plasmid stabilization system protein ParE